jgi:hypothetical protein
LLLISLSSELQVQQTSTLLPDGVIDIVNVCDVMVFDMIFRIDKLATGCILGIRFATLYCNKQTREAFRLLFREFFSVVEQVTKCPLEFRRLAGEDSEAKLRGICFDAEVAQFQAFGDTLLGMNNPSISGIHTTDPLEIAAFFSKSCSVHFVR